MKAGTYVGRATGDLKFGRSETGTETVGALFEITSSDFAGRRAAWYGSLGSEESIAFCQQALMAAGWDGKDWSKMTGLGSVECLLVFEEEPDTKDKTKTRIRLRYINRLTSLKLNNELAAADRGRLFARLNAMKSSTPRPPLPEDEFDRF